MSTSNHNPGHVNPANCPTPDPGAASTPAGKPNVRNNVMPSPQSSGKMYDSNAHVKLGTTRNNHNVAAALKGGNTPHAHALPNTY